ncbi:MAG TPA: DUF5985 family protein [Terracidiphilus sp.]|nr:DUF5985 family protein [Terracidiphilus sp.]
MGPAVYILGTLVSLASGVLLLRSYFRGRHRLLLWSGLCFLGLTIANLLVFVDLVMLPNVDLYLLRLSVTAVAMMLLLYGLIWEGE